MDKRNDHDYYLARAKASRELALRAASPAAAAIHSELAQRYEAAAFLLLEENYAPLASDGPMRMVA